MNRAAIALRSVQRESQKGVGYAAHWFMQRFYLRYLHHRFALTDSATQADLERKITVVIPAVGKDAPMLRHCLQAVRKMVKQQMTAIWVVAPESKELRQIATEESCEFILEGKVLPRPSAELKCRGWVLQQIIKFNASFHVTTDDYLVLDSDTMFLRPQTFFRVARPFCAIPISTNYFITVH